MTGAKAARNGFPKEDDQRYIRGGKGNDAVLSVRPKVAELTFQLYGRVLHPELFEVYQTRRVKRGRYEAKIDITSAGHVMAWRYDGIILTEVAAAANHPLPRKRRLMSYRLEGDRSDRLKCRGGVVYRTDFQMESYDQDLFLSFQQELATDRHRRGMMHTFGASGRVALGAVSYINVETRDRSMFVQAFHTFPDDCAIVKTQSHFELP